MERQWQRWLAPLSGLGPPVEIAEAGIGTPDTSMPWYTGQPESMTTPEGRNVTRHYVRAVARFAEKHDPPLPVTFWTVNQCDWLGLRPEWRRFAIDDLAEWVRDYNHKCTDGL
jgi:hypothetical protein